MSGLDWPKGYLPLLDMLRRMDLILTVTRILQLHLVAMVVVVVRPPTQSILPRVE